MAAASTRFTGLSPEAAGGQDLRMGDDGCPRLLPMGCRTHCHVRFAMREIGLSDAIYSARALRPTRNRATAVSTGAAAARSI